MRNDSEKSLPNFTIPHPSMQSKTWKDLDDVRNTPSWPRNDVFIVILSILKYLYEQRNSDTQPFLYSIFLREFLEKFENFKFTTSIALSI